MPSQGLHLYFTKPYFMSKKSIFVQGKVFIKFGESRTEFDQLLIIYLLNKFFISLSKGVPVGVNVRPEKIFIQF